jgi:GAF domain-containing protein
MSLEKRLGARAALHSRHLARAPMDHYSILDHSSSSLAVEAAMPGPNASGSVPPSISAGIAAANALLPKLSETGPRFPAEDGGRSLAEMAHADLDAALQLLAERAQYITGASGVAIALRRGARNDMLCRASAGDNAPELGALLSMEYGLSGESVRTRQLLRCDDAERDPRVNHDVCRELGIASVVVMPIVDDDRVLGVFELLSGKPRAFDERDLSALLRLSEMVETAVRHALIPPTVPEADPLETATPKVAAAKVVPAPVAPSESQSESEFKAQEIGTAPAAAFPAQTSLPPKPPAAPPAPKKPLFWSAAMRALSSEQPKNDTPAVAVPATLRNLQKCQACGFPVSQGRAFCVECEERQWRGQRLAHPELKARQDEAKSPGDHEKDRNRNHQKEKNNDAKANAQAAPPVPKAPAVAVAVAAAVTEPVTERETEQPTQATFIQDFLPNPVQPAPPATSTPVPPIASAAAKPSQDGTSEAIASIIAEADAASQPSATSSPAAPSDQAPADSTLFLTASQSESWFASNKYILGTLLVVAITIAAIAWLR